MTLVGDALAESAADALADAPGDAPGDALAARWLACFERVAAAAAHEVNNALNGVAMNLEVVRLRARPGGDAGAVAPFAAAGTEEHAATVALVGALLALGRAPREGTAAGGGSADVASVLGHAVALFTPVLRHRGVTLQVDVPDGPARTTAPPRAVRLAVCAALEAVAGDAGRRAGPPAVLPGRASGRVVRCTLESGGAPTLVVAPGPDEWDAAVRDALGGAGVRVTRAPDALRIAFPPV